jgi:hypothetical protein
VPGSQTGTKFSSALAIVPTCHNLAMDEFAPRGTLVPEPAAALPVDARALAETLAERLDLAVGTSRLELVFERGRLVHLWRHEKIKATSLEPR